MKTIQIPKYLEPHLASKRRKFNDVAVLVDLVIAKRSPSLLICGQPGIGKTRLVKDRFMAAHQLEDFDYRIVKGHGSALGLYALLHENREQTLVLDDADSMFMDPRGTNILKAALDSYDVRTISWQSASAKSMDVPSSFLFTGSVIFVSNINENEMDKAVLSRSFHCNLVLTPDEILATMYEVIDKIEPKVRLDHRMQVLRVLEANRGELVSSGKFNLRTLVNGIRIRTSDAKNWKRMVIQYA